jgi:hypothetical protein
VDGSRSGLIETDSRSAMRRTVFLYDDGVVLCATTRALDELGILEPSLEAPRTVRELYPDISDGGFGYLRAGLRSFAAQGWLSEGPALDPSEARLEWTDAGRAAAANRDRYIALGRYLAGFDDNDPAAWGRPWRGDRADRFDELLDGGLARWRLEGDPSAEQAESMRAHLDAALAIPALLSLRAWGRLGEDGPRLADDGIERSFGRFLETLGWVDGDEWTDMGRLARDYVIHFGIVGSYLPMLARLPELYRGELKVAPDPHSDEAEWHVNRELNVIASAAAHRRYFADADEIFIDIFGREPLADQPRFIADMGCGDGSWLVHLHRLIRERTPRGQALESEPLLMVGVDCNEAALDAARRTLADADVPGLLVFGDVSDPEELGDTLAEHGLPIEDGLHIRSFLDHDRSFTGGDGGVEVAGTSSGAYVDPEGRAVDPADVERDLVTHLRRWTPLVGRHGLVVLEAHCVEPAVASRHRGALHSVAFDSYHAYSHQYPVEYSSFIRCCRQAGLERVSHRERHYPSSRPFVAVSLNRLLARRAEDELLPAISADGDDRGWRPDPGIESEDGEALHRLLFAAGDLAHPRLWCAPATGYVVAGALERIEERIAAGAAGETVRVLDYGAGTGLAAIELLKACRERGIDRLLSGREMELELHLADLPSSWFARGYELLRDCSWTRFHSLRADDGSFRPLRELTDGERMDAVMANMVFHLIPPAALRELAAELASVIEPGGCLVWSSPDLGPAGPHAVLFHDPNRLLRAKWLRLLAGEGTAPPRGNGGSGGGPSRELLETADEIRSSLDPAAALEAERRANRRILPRAHDAADVAAALRSNLEGEVLTRSHEMLDEEVLEAILVPSNQGEFISEIADRERRERTILELMEREVLPEMRAGPAGTALGLNIQWTLGTFTRP